MTDNNKNFSLFNARYNRKIQQSLLSQIEKDKHYIEELERLLNAHEINILNEIIDDYKNPISSSVNTNANDEKFAILQADYGIDGSLDSLQKHLKLVQTYIRRFPLYVQFKDLSYWNLIPDKQIVTVGTTVKNILFGSGKKHRFNVLQELTGRIAPAKITLLMGPPSSGKTSLLKALSGQLVVGSSHLDGEITYNQDGFNSKKFLSGKVASYVDEKDEHIPTLTVKETSEFAFKISTGGHHGYQVSQMVDPTDTTATTSGAKADQFFEEADRISLKMNNILRMLGIYECSSTLVGDGMLRGVSGGQKRRVTIAEMMMLPRYISFMDSISNGLDSQTTFEIIRSIRTFSRALGFTTVISLLQPSPEVFYTFDELILLGSGQIIYHGPINETQRYFENLGYVVPCNMGIADFLQELPTISGKRFLKPNSLVKGSIDELVKAWKSSRSFANMIEEMELYNKEGTYDSHEINVTDDVESNQICLKHNVSFKKINWWKEHNEKYPSAFAYQLKLCLERQKKIVYRDLTLLKGTVIRVIIISMISGTLFSNLPTTDFYGVSGFLFFSSMTNAVNGFASLPKIYEQRAVFYKHARAYFYPASAFVFSQTLVMCPIQFFESAVFSIIVYWSVGLSSANHGGRFFTFVLLTYLFSLSMGQFFRALGSIASSAQTAAPLGGVALILMVLFSGYILPKNQIPDGWIWFYWLNPLAYVFKAYLINEYTSSDYDFQQCLNADCSKTERFGDWVLSNVGIPTDYAWVWYCALILFALYIFYMVSSVFLYEHIRHVTISLPNEEKHHHDDDIEPVKQEILLNNDIIVDLPEVSVKEENDVTITSSNGNNQDNVELNSSKVIGIDFEPISFVFRDIWYKVQLKHGKEINLLKGVSGFFEPGHMTALMGSSGAGKTTLLDVLSGRKTTGVITGDILLNGKPKNDHSFRKLIGYVEQFDTLSPQDTAREAIAFSAAMRLPGGTVAADSWVTCVLNMLELTAIEDTMIGTMDTGGMSFEQRKRVSLGVELAANPAILFLDEPTTGLDSRAAQVVIRCIKRLLLGGRSVVCTIHQPSTYIFESFDKLLLLKRGGQTVFFGDLGKNSSSLVSYFQEIPDVKPKEQYQNPATYMLQVIGAGTDSKSSLATIDFHEYYKSSVLCSFNTNKVNILCTDEDVNLEKKNADHDHHDEEGEKTILVYNATYLMQFRYLMYRALLTYWRSPSYNFARIAVCTIIAFIFASAYSNQVYSTKAECISRVALIYITTSFLGIVGLQIVQPVIFSQRPSFYREKFINIYDVKLYTIAHTLVEIPYLAVSSILFLIPFFFIIGFNDGDVAVKFFYYWLFQALYIAASVFIGIMLASSLPDPGVSSIVSGLLGTCFSLFCGFTILYQDFPSFWHFMYWLDPLHYAVEGTVVTQFYGDDSKVTLSTGGNTTTTAEIFVNEYYSEWKYSNRYVDLIALIIFILCARVLTYLGLEYVNHAKR